MNHEPCLHKTLHTPQDAIARNVQVLCESSKRLDARLRSDHPEIDWKGIAGMRNVLVHDYFDIDFETIWDVVVKDLPKLETAIRAILTKLGPTEVS